jgi:hypothetical protein
MFSRVECVGFTRRDNAPKSKPMFCNAGMVIVRAGEKACQFFDEWYTCDTELFNNASLHRPWIRKYYGMNQAALGRLAETKGLLKRYSVSFFTCRTLNNIQPWPEWEKSYFIHVKSNLRRAIQKPEINIAKVDVGLTIRWLQEEAESKGKSFDESIVSQMEPTSVKFYRNGPRSYAMNRRGALIRKRMASNHNKRNAN